MMNVTQRVPSVLAAIVLLAAVSAAHAGGYSIINLSIPGGSPTDYQYAEAINDSGQVVLSDEEPGVSYDYTAVDDLYNLHTHVYTPLPAYPGSTANSTEVFDINDSGEMTGEYHAVGIEWGGFTLKGGVFAPAGYTSAIDNEPITISNNGNLTGSYLDTLGNAHGFAIVGGVTTTLDVPSAWGAQTTGSGVNDAGTVVGGYVPVSNPAGLESYVEQGGVYTQLTIPGFADVGAAEINDSDVIVGYAYNGLPETDDVGFIDRGGVFTLFTVPGASSTDIDDIDDHGDISGDWIDPQGLYHPFVALAVPEPAAWATMLLGLAGLGALARRRSGAAA